MYSLILLSSTAVLRVTLNIEEVSRYFLNGTRRCVSTVDGLVEWLTIRDSGTATSDGRRDGRPFICRI